MDPVNLIWINLSRRAISFRCRQRSSDLSDAWSTVLSTVHESNAARLEGGSHLVYRFHEDVGLALLDPDHDLPANPGSVGEFFLAEAEQCPPRSHRRHYFRCRIHGFIKNGTALALSTIVPKDSIGLLIRDIIAQGADNLQRNHLIRGGVHRSGNLITILGTLPVADIAVAVRRTLQGFEESGDRIRISGHPVILSEKQTQGLSLDLYELATNALKYGAPSVDEGNSRWTGRFRRNRS